MIRQNKKQRIIFIDLLRAFAVLQMVQGHTIDVLLANEYRNFSSISYSIWHFMRGMTAPIFMFTSGMVFTYLFRLVDEPFEKNPRVLKGIKRFLLLITIGYLLRFPTFNPFNFTYITDKQLKIFYSVDVLHLIGFGLLIIMFFCFLSEKLNLSDTLIFILGASLFILPTPIFSKIEWTNYLPTPLANYFYTGAGSLFPLFPWVGYLLIGSILGSILAENSNIFQTRRFSYIIISLGLMILFLTLLINYIFNSSFKIIFDSYNYLTIVFRIGFVLTLSGVVSLISQSIQSIPNIIILIGRNTLLIYIVHLMILYGSAISPGLNIIWGNKLNPIPTISLALLMILLMIGIVILLNKLKLRNKQLVT